jgi:hypothetical protein
MDSANRDLSLLNDPVAQHLLTSTAPARPAYTWSDGTPRVIPICFHWDGEAIVQGSPVKAPHPDHPAVGEHPGLRDTVAQRLDHLAFD